MRTASVLSTEVDLDAAVGDAAPRLKDALGSDPSLVFAFPSASWGEALDALPGRLGAAVGGAPIVGCSSGGQLASGLEIERGAPGLALFALVLPEEADVGVRVLPPSGEGIAEDGGVGAVLLAEPMSFEVEDALRAHDAAHAGRPLIGGLASGARRPGDHALFAGDRAVRSGGVHITFDGPLRLDAAVAQGCRPIGEPMIVTRCEGPRIFELDRGRPLEVVRALHASLPEADRALMGHSLFLGVEMASKREYRAGDFLIRNVLGIEADSGALIVGAHLAEYPVVQFHLRDGATSAEDLAAVLERDFEQHGPAAGALMFSCLGRGEGLYREPHHDSRRFLARHPGAGLGGFFCNGEIGPVGPRTYLHGYTSSFGLFRPAL
jgi:small ligand-binding sensory domain FIST